jgi:hypothetical protein
VATAIGIVAVAAGLGVRRHGPAAHASRLRGASGWLLLVVAVTAFELWQLFSLPRRLHPTLSSLLGDVTRFGAARGAVFGCWLLAGAVLALRGRLR